MLSKSQSIRIASTTLVLLLLSACFDNQDSATEDKPVIRGLKTVLVQDEERTTERKYPSVLQPSSISSLSFEISGKLSDLKLDVGQIVKKGDVLARLDPTTLNLQVESADAGVRQAESAARTAREDYDRKTALLTKGVITQADADQSRNASESADALLVQAVKQLATTREDLTKTTLKAPFDGIINTVEADSYTNVSAGAAIATIYSADAFEVSFSVSYDVINLLVVGKKAVLRLADNPALVFDGYVSEIGSRADTVSSFPVVVALDGADPVLKAGMAMEVSLEFAVARGKGFTLPLTVLALEGTLDTTESLPDPTHAHVYVFDAATSTVKRQKVVVAGVRENALIIIDGLKAGDRVASAGVSFLRDGQTVKLLPEMAGNN